MYLMIVIWWCPEPKNEVFEIRNKAQLNKTLSCPHSRMGRASQKSNRNIRTRVLTTMMTGKHIVVAFSWVETWELRPFLRPSNHGSRIFCSARANDVDEIRWQKAATKADVLGILRIRFQSWISWLSYISLISISSSWGRRSVMPAKVIDDLILKSLFLKALPPPPKNLSVPVDAV